MAITIEALRDKVKHMQQELAEVSAGLEELSKATHSNVTQPAAVVLADPLAMLPRSDPKELRRIFDRVAAEMGIDVSKPAPTAREAREMMLREGIRPEENILSRGIIEAREE